VGRTYSTTSCLPWHVNFRSKFMYTNCLLISPVTFSLDLAFSEEKASPSPHLASAP
jgi:hypothetical protein